MCCDVTVRLAPPESLVCITGTLRLTGRGWRSRVSGANAFMLLIQLLSGVIPACQFVWAADLHNEFILAGVLHTLPPSLPSLSSVPLSLFLSSVLKGPRTNYQKGHFHLWTAGFNRYLFHAFKINPILLLSVWFVYFALEYSFSGRGEMHGMQFTLNLHYIGFLYWLIKHAKRTFP